MTTRRVNGIDSTWLGRTITGIVVGIAVITAPAQSASARVSQSRLLLIVAGQSNAIGWQSYAVDPTTHVDYFAPPYTNEADKLSTIAWDQSSVSHPREQGSLDTRQMTSLKPRVQIFGPEIGLARSIYADTGRAVSIVKVTSIPGIASWSPSARHGYFQQMVSLVRKTMARDRGRGLLDTIGGFYWYQGESDAMSPGVADGYQANLVGLIDAVRSELPLGPTAPVVLAKESLATVIGALEAANGCGLPPCPALVAGDPIVRAADDWAAAHLPHVMTVDTLGLARTGGGIHLSNVAELELGQEMATASESQLP